MGFFMIDHTIIDYGFNDRSYNYVFFMIDYTILTRTFQSNSAINVEVRHSQTYYGGSIRFL